MVRVFVAYYCSINKHFKSDVKIIVRDVRAECYFCVIHAVQQMQQVDYAQNRGFKQHIVIFAYCFYSIFQIYKCAMPQYQAQLRECANYFFGIVSNIIKPESRVYNHRQPVIFRSFIYSHSMLGSNAEILASWMQLYAPEALQNSFLILTLPLGFWVKPEEWDYPIGEFPVKIENFVVLPCEIADQR